MQSRLLAAVALAAVAVTMTLNAASKHGGVKTGALERDPAPLTSTLRRAIDDGSLAGQLAVVAANVTATRVVVSSVCVSIDAVVSCTLGAGHGTLYTPLLASVLVAVVDDPDAAAVAAVANITHGIRVGRVQKHDLAAVFAAVSATATAVSVSVFAAVCSAALMWLASRGGAFRYLCDRMTAIAQTTVAVLAIIASAAALSLFMEHYDWARKDARIQDNNTEYPMVVSTACLPSTPSFKLSALGYASASAAGIFFTSGRESILVAIAATAIGAAVAVVRAAVKSGKRRFYAPCDQDRITAASEAAGHAFTPIVVAVFTLFLMRRTRLAFEHVVTACTPIGIHVAAVALAVALTLANDGQSDLCDAAATYMITVLAAHIVYAYMPVVAPQDKTQHTPRGPSHVSYTYNNTVVLGAGVPVQHAGIAANAPRLGAP